MNVDISAYGSDLGADVAVGLRLADPLGAEVHGALTKPILDQVVTPLPAVGGVPPGEEPRHLRVGPKKVEVHADALGQVLRVAPAGLQVRDRLLEVRQHGGVQDLLKQRFLAREVVVEEPLRNAGALGDLAGSGPGEAVLGEFDAGGVEDRGPGSGGVSLGSFRSGHRSSFLATALRRLYRLTD